MIDRLHLPQTPRRALTAAVAMAALAFSAHESISAVSASEHDRTIQAQHCADTLGPIATDAADLTRPCENPDYRASFPYRQSTITEVNPGETTESDESKILATSREYQLPSADRFMQEFKARGDPKADDKWALAVLISFIAPLGLNARWHRQNLKERRNQVFSQY